MTNSTSGEALPNLCVSYSIQYVTHGEEVSVYKGNLEVPNDANIANLDSWVKYKEYQQLADKYGQLRIASANAISVYRNALNDIVSWKLPKTGRMWDDRSEMSYTAVYGTEGTREHIQSVALNGLKAGQEAYDHKQAQDDANDAAKWRALLNCARIVHVGSVGLDQPLPDNFAHLTISFSTIRDTDVAQSAANLLDKFARIAFVTSRGAPRGEFDPPLGDEHVT